MNENKGKELVKIFRERGVSQREFCSKHNIKRSTLRYWLDRVKDFELGNKVGFYEITINGENK